MKKMMELQNNQRIFQTILIQDIWTNMIFRKEIFHIIIQIGNTQAAAVVDLSDGDTNSVARICLHFINLNLKSGQEHTLFSASTS